MFSTERYRIFEKSKRGRHGRELRRITASVARGAIPSSTVKVHELNKEKQHGSKPYETEAIFETAIFEAGISEAAIFEAAIFEAALL